MLKPILLPTKEATYLYYKTVDELALLPSAEVMSFINGQSANQHLYIIDTEAKIEEGDWYELNGKVLQLTEDDSHIHNQAKKIIATTDKSLNLPLINEEFVKEYVEKQGKIEIGKVYSSYEKTASNLPVAIVTPKESDDVESAAKKYSEISWKGSPMEEFAEPNKIAEAGAFKAGVQWQKERSFTREEVIDIISRLPLGWSKIRETEWISKNLSQTKS